MKKRFFISVILTLPIMFFTSKYIWAIKLIIPVSLIFINMSSLYMNCDDSFSVFDNISRDLSNLLFSDSNKFELNEAKVRDFIRVAEQGGSGSYPEDFNERGYGRDDGSIIHSKAPIDWGVDELYNFGDYNDLSKRKTSASQMVLWLEYDFMVNQNKYIKSAGIESTFNTSGNKWYESYCKENNVAKSNQNTYAFRQNLRIFAAKN